MKVLSELTSKSKGLYKTLSNDSNSLPNDKILDWSKLKELADNKVHVAQMRKIVSVCIENIVEKGENAGYQHFLLFPQGFCVVKG